MYLTMTLVCFVVILIATYATRNTILNEACEEYLGLFYIQMVKEGIEDLSDIAAFMVSFIIYFIVVGILSLLWFIILPLGLVFWILSKTLKRKV